MSGDLREFHDELREVARSLLGEASARADAGSAPILDWALLAASGWLGLELPERVGGSGAGIAEQAVILVEIGRVAAAGPYLGSVALGAAAIGALEPGLQSDELLRAIAEGGRRSTLVIATGDDGLVDDLASFRLRSGRLMGKARFVPDAEGAELLILARDEADVPLLVHLDEASSATLLSPEAVLDASRQLSSVTSEGLELEPSMIWAFNGDPDLRVRQLGHRAGLAVACDSLGIAEAMLEATVSYTSQRHQFGRPIASFQAVKHACADMLVRILISRELVAAAVQELADGGGAAAPSVSMAKAHATETAVAVAGKAMQLHGGIGYTWEGGIHRYLKRALLNRSLFGSPPAHRQQLAGRYERAGAELDMG